MSSQAWLLVAMLALILRAPLFYATRWLLIALRDVARAFVSIT